MPLVIKVVQQPHRAPQVVVGALQPREMPQRRGHSIAVLAQALGLDPLAQECLGMFGVHKILTLVVFHARARRGTGQLIRTAAFDDDLAIS
ncbi:MAG: hypothetical protein U0Z44_12690 [Kouleothrix sp.]